jgi:hypothetical protein
VPVTAAAQCAKRVVAVDQLEAVEADHLVEALHDGVVITSEIVAGCEYVRRVEAYAEPFSHLRRLPVD